MLLGSLYWSLKESHSFIFSLEIFIAPVAVDPKRSTTTKNGLCVCQIWGAYQTPRPSLSYPKNREWSLCILEKQTVLEPAANDHKFHKGNLNRDTHVDLLTLWCLQKWKINSLSPKTDIKSKIFQIISFFGQGPLYLFVSVSGQHVCNSVCSLYKQIYIKFLHWVLDIRKIVQLP